MKPKETETGLVLHGTAKLGSMLVDEAAKINQEKIQKRVIGVIAQILEQVEVQKQAMKVLNDQIKALRSGAFTLNKEGLITYNDPELNKHTRAIVPCGQCGYEKIVFSNLR